MEIERSGTSIVFEATINELTSVSYRFLSNIEYEISIYEVGNDTRLYHDEILLDQPFKLVDFGFFEQEVPIVPVPEFLNIMTQWGIILLFISIFTLIGFIAWVKFKKEQYKKDRRELGYTPSVIKKDSPFY